MLNQNSCIVLEVYNHYLTADSLRGRYRFPLRYNFYDSRLGLRKFPDRHMGQKWYLSDIE
ncbi:hypothetical protein HOLleu_19412 [Holothuria leucospilota]|uniref:Uncharacterized protein n=1 Tax=Holothuria leucospilota TaxID=206669 RepID=A0A9Q1BZ84_HOLLE|nr:hypothetical protein HOLleu_19412 [Holothuria leucospilota]